MPTDHVEIQYKLKLRTPEIFHRLYWRKRHIATLAVTLLVVEIVHQMYEG